MTDENPADFGLEKEFGSRDTVNPSDEEYVGASSTSTHRQRIMLKYIADTEGTRLYFKAPK